MHSSHAAAICRAVLDSRDFIGSTFSGHVRGAELPWTRVTLRPVRLSGGDYVQFSYYTDRRGITKNYADEAVAQQLDELIGYQFAHISVRTAAEVLDIHVLKSGTSRLRRRPATEPAAPPDLSHDRTKAHIITPENARELLTALDMLTRDGVVQAERQRKLRQINEFIKLVQQTGRLEQLTSGPVRVVDFGCGNAYLTFAIYHYLRHILGAPTQVVGVDLNLEAVQRNTERVEALGWDGLEFQVGRIGDAPLAAAEIVLALHACDTATDEALARAIAWQSPLVVAVPCCHHDIQVQLERAAASDASRALLRDSILRERLGDVLTDAFRAQILRLMGYHTEVLQFISPEHTAKNVMLRAAQAQVTERSRYLQEYRELKATWGVTPMLERLLADRGIQLEP